LSQASWYRWEGNDLLINVRVQPRARRDELGEPLGDQLRVRITAPPVEGKANEHLIRFLADRFGVPMARVALVSGGQGRSKRLRIAAPARLPDGVVRP
jgi:uncharacterized protein